MKHSGNIALLLFVALGIYLLADKTGSATGKKIGVVQMEKLVYDFKGMKEATKKYTQKAHTWAAESDSLGARLEKLYRQIQQDSVDRDRVGLQKHLQTFIYAKRAYVDVIRRNEEQGRKEDQEMTLGVVNQIHEYMKSYAEQEGYDVILCNSTQQSVGYARNQVDITEKMLDFANTKYDGQ